MPEVHRNIFLQKEILVGNECLEILYDAVLFLSCALFEGELWFHPPVPSCGFQGKRHSHFEVLIMR